MAGGNWSGRLLIRSFAKMRIGSVGGEVSYTALGYHACGTVGQMTVSFAIFLEFFGLVLTLLIFLWRHLAILLPSISYPELIIVSSIILLPSVWMVNLSELAIVSLIGMISSVLTTAATVLIFFGAVSGHLWFDDFQGELPAQESIFRFENLGLSAGIFLCTLAGHGCLPSVYSNMEKPEEFGSMLNVVFTVMCGLYIIVSLILVYIFGDNCKILMTENFADWPGSKDFIVLAIIIFLLLKLVCTLGALVHILCEIPEAFMKMKSRVSQTVFRSCVYLACCVLAYFANDHLDVVEAVTGAFATMLTSFIFPLLFYLILYFQDLNTIQRFAYSITLTIVLILTVWFVWQDVLKCVQQRVE